MIKQIQKRTCLYSGEEFIPKRNNQVFANKYNRISFHNQINNKLRNELKQTNNQLMVNYKIGIELLSKEKTITIHREFLKGKGFDFKFFTNLTENDSKSGYTFALYDTSFEKIDDNTWNLTGVYTIAGVSKEYKTQVKVTTSKGNIILQGSNQITFGDFEMTPPKAALGVVKAGKDLTVIFNIILS